MNSINKLNELHKEKHKRDEVFQAFGLNQCHQLDFEIELCLRRITVEANNLLKEVLL